VLEEVRSCLFKNLVPPHTHTHHASSPTPCRRKSTGPGSKINRLTPTRRRRKTRKKRYAAILRIKSLSPCSVLVLLLSFFFFEYCYCNHFSLSFLPYTCMCTVLTVTAGRRSRGQARDACQYVLLLALS
jgi:hypothetical protein